MEVLPNVTERLLDIDEVERMLALKRTAIRERYNPRSRYYDPSFPKPVSIGFANSKRFVASEIQAYIAHLIESGRG